METFVTADTHFWHKNILKYQAKDRPYTDIREMNETIIENWNSMVNPGDVVYHLGDFGFCSANQTVEILDRLNGTIRFIRGNHDKQMFDARVLLTDSIEWIRDYYELRGFNKAGIMMFHYPLMSWNKMHFGAYHFYGHTHGQIPFVYHGLGMDVGMDTNNCKPYHIPTLVDDIEKVVDSLGEETAIVDSRSRGRG